MAKEETINIIKKHIAFSMPKGVKVILFGSQARRDANENSDWDILILVDKAKLDENDYDTISYPLFELGWNINVQIHPILYTFKEWVSRKMSPFYKNVTEEGIELC